MTRDTCPSPVVLAGLTGLRHLRSMVTERSFRVLQLRSDDYTYIR